MTTTQRVAQIFGAVFLLIGIAGFFFSTSMEEGLLLGMFPVNIVHNIVHILLGVWGITAAKSFAGAKSYAQIAGVLYLILAVLGFIDPTGFGIVPLGGNDIWLHAVLGVALAFVGFTARDGATVTS